MAKDNIQGVNNMEVDAIKQGKKIYVLNTENKELVSFLEGIQLQSKTIVFNSYNNTWVLPHRYAGQVEEKGFHVVDNPSERHKDMITVKAFVTVRRNEQMMVFQCPKMTTADSNTLRFQLHSQQVNNVHYVHRQFALQAIMMLRRLFNIEYSEGAQAFFNTLVQEKADREKVANNDYSDIDWGNIVDFNAKLKDYQAKNQTKLLFAGRVTSQPNCTCDFSGVGVGKSIQAIATSLYYRQKGLIKYAIICVPGVLRNEFASEIEKFAPNVGYEKIEGYNHELDDTKFFKIVSYALFCDYKRKGKKKASIAERLLAPIAHQSFIVFDESQKLGNMQSGRTKNAIKLCNGLFKNEDGVNYRRAFGVRIMTGTPFGTGVTKLWPQLVNLGIEKEVSPNFSIFKQNYSKGFIMKRKCPKTGREIEHYKETDSRRENLPDLYNRLDYCSVRVRIQDVIKDLPPLIRKVIHVDLPAKDRKSYDEAEADIIRWIHENIDGQAAWRAKKNEAAIRVGKLNQISAMGKVKDTAELLKILVENGEKPVVFCSYRAPLIELSKMFPEFSLAISGAKASEIDDFKAGKTAGLLVSTAKGNYGLNLQYVSNVQVWLNQPPRPDMKTQGEGRVYRTGQDKPCIIYNMLASNTIDIRQCKVIDSRQESIDTFFGEEKQLLLGKEIEGNKDIENSIAVHLLKARFEELRSKSKAS
jgi:SNF2 family DNA or RNA helicase